MTSINKYKKTTTTEQSEKVVNKMQPLTRNDVTSSLLPTSFNT